MLKIKSISEIKNDLLLNKQAVRNFPRSVNFKFDALYLDIVTQISTIEISAECVFFDSVQSVNETKEFSDPDYWSQNYTSEEIEKYWVFAQNGQGDLWLFDSANKIYFYDHNQVEMSSDNFIDLDLNFEKWLQFADLNKQFQNICDSEDELNDNYKSNYQNKLKEISSSLFDKYPFDI